MCSSVIEVRDESLSEPSVDDVSVVARAMLPTRYGTFQLIMFRVEGIDDEFIALIHGDLETAQPALVRLHSECLTGDVLGSLRCDCGEQLELSLHEIGRAPCGVLLYLRQEGRGIGLANKIRAYALQDDGLDTVDANIALGLPVDGREYASAARILEYLGITNVRLLTNNPSKAEALRKHGIPVRERVPLEIQPNRVNHHYLHTKVERMGHLLELSEPTEQAEPSI